jgi:MoaA/NifB/PqqE/SkfB family radical SAM enzyme
MKNICVMPWIAVDRNRNNKTGKTTLSPCCFYEGDEEHQDIDNFWNSDELKKLRKDFISGKRPTGCRLCWKAEDNGIKSMRQSVNEGRLSEYKERITHTEVKLPPTQIKFTVGEECNLACRMCLPNFSTKVRKVWDIIGRKQDMELDNILNVPEYILQNRKNINYIDILGGEPFYHKKAKNLLRQLVESGDNNHITLHITTNATRIDNDTVDLIKKFKDVVLSISMEGVGEIQEYIRPGCDWDRLVDNIRLLKKNNISIQVVSTLSVLTLLRLPDLEEWCSKNNIFWAQPGLVDNPPELSPHNLPYQLHELVPEKYKKYLQSKATHDPLNFIEQLDKFWKTDITKVMPEWKKVFDNLHWKENDRLERLNEVAKSYVD